MKWRRWSGLVLVLLAGTVVMPAQAIAQYESPSYQIEEYSLDSGGTFDAMSPNYNLRGSIGDLSAGNATSPNYQLWSGYTTSEEEYLEFVVTGATLDFGVLDTGLTSTATATFYVRSYLSNGYVVTTDADPPTNATHQLAPMTGGGAAAPGTEQFGINLVDNSSPNIGANPSQYPDSTFGFGYAASGYDTADSFRYNKGDIVARADTSSGRTDYTMSYIMNISNVTPGGVYTMLHTLVATATY